ncbi:MAG: gliding motility-associated C-terminal domain-containing protein [Bacteroidales bacterium]
MYQPNSYGVPTAFSPNGDGDNDRLYVYGSQFKEVVFRVYNRYGEMVFETNDELRGWDGKHNGFPQEKEVYTYYLKIIFADGGLVEETGNVTLLR